VPATVDPASLGLDGIAGPIANGGDNVAVYAPLFASPRLKLGSTGWPDPSSS
jgi:hypothetical protein